MFQKKNFEVKTFGTSNADYIFNITNVITPFKEKFDIVFHVAGKAHSVPKIQEEESVFYKVNFEGTKNLCNALEENLPVYFVFISTVAVYGKDFGENIT